MQEQVTKSRIWRENTMNKQVLIEILEGRQDWKCSLGSSFNEGYQGGINFSIGLARSLDESQKPIVPKCFDIDYKKYKYMENNKSEILLTALGGIYRTTFTGSFSDLSPDVWKTGIKWNKWTKETILWASINYADFCQAVISGDYEVEKEQLYVMPIPHVSFPVHYCVEDDHISFRQGNAQKFTQVELDKYFPDIKQLAVPVDEVEEG